MIYQNHTVEKEQLQKNIEQYYMKIRECEKKINDIHQWEIEKFPHEKNFNSAFNSNSIKRYSRQLLVKDFGVKGQLKLNHSKVLIIGAGGLGSPAALYLAGAGVGTIGIIDFDQIERSNLHRQIIHRDCDVGISKVLSAKRAVEGINPTITCVAYNLKITGANACEIISKYDAIIDATDNPKTRYIVNDACVHMKKPLISGGAISLEGHVAVYNHEDGPCYRCCYPQELPPDMNCNCSDTGVIGAVPGVIGCLQAMETIKILVGMGKPLNSMQCVYDAFDGSFRTIKMKKKRDNCITCGIKTKLNDSLTENYSLPNPFNHLNSIHQNIKNITCQEMWEYKQKGWKHIVLDVRNQVEYQICSLRYSINIPLRCLKLEIKQQLDQQNKVFVICRRGNDSILATSILMDYEFKDVYNVTGGLLEWTKTVDPHFPIY